MHCHIAAFAAFRLPLADARSADATHVCYSTIHFLQNIVHQFITCFLWLQLTHLLFFLRLRRKVLYHHDTDIWRRLKQLLDTLHLNFANLHRQASL